MSRHKRLTSGIASAVATTFLGVSLAAAQQPLPNPTPAPQPVPQLRLQPPERTSVEMTLKGELVRVDTTAKMFTIKTDEGKFELVRYTDATKVTGAQAGIAGLTNADGTTVTVTFTGIGAARVASEIVVDRARS